MYTKPSHEKGKMINDNWMVIFADLLALLLTFFVLMFSMNSVQVSKWEAVIASLSEHLNAERAEVQDEDWKNIEKALVKQKQALSLMYLKKVFEEKLQHDAILSRSNIKLDDDRLVISLPADLIFETGSSRLSNDAYASMQELGAALQYVQNKITVVGHTDPEPTSGVRYPTNWELSLVRAISVSRMIKEAGYRDRIETYGNGSSRFKELSDDIPLHLRYQSARRVDVYIHQEDRTNH